MTQDRSVNFEDTREFVKNRLENANQLKRATLAVSCVDIVLSYNEEFLRASVSVSSLTASLNFA